MKVTIEGFVHWHKYEWDDKSTFHFVMHEMTHSGPEWVVIKPHAFEVEIPDDFDPKPLQIKALQEEKKNLFAEAQVKANNIDEQIQRLLCIEYKPSDIDEAEAEALPF